jgi:hypothetical protein
MMASTKFDFKDVPDNLRLIREIKEPLAKTKGKLMPTYRAFVDTVGRHWLNYRVEFVEKAHSSMRTLVNTTYNKMEEYNHD